MTPEDLELLRKLYAMVMAKTYTPEFFEGCRYLTREYPGVTDTQSAIWNEALAKVKESP